MPLGTALLLGAQCVRRWFLGVELLVLDRADGADLGVTPPQLALGVENGVDVKPRRSRPPRQFTKTQDKLLLEIVGQAILGAEENDATLRNWFC